MLSAGFRRAAEALGLRIAGMASWDPETRELPRLAARVARARPEAVFLSGIAFDNGGPLVRRCERPWAGTSSSWPRTASPSFRSWCDEAGAAAEGMYVSVDGAPNSALGRAGKRFIADFAATQPGGVVPSYTAAYAGQAAEVLLEAIARSDGTRPSVTKELFGASRPRRDPRAPSGSTATATRRQPDHDPARDGRARRASPTLLADHVGTVLDRVLTPPARARRGRLRYGRLQRIGTSTRARYSSKSHTRAATSIVQSPATPSAAP